MLSKRNGQSGHQAVKPWMAELGEVNLRDVEAVPGTTKQDRFLFAHSRSDMFKTHSQCIGAHPHQFSTIKQASTTKAVYLRICR